MKNEIVIGNVVKELKLCRGIFDRRLRWRWKRRHMLKLKISPSNAMNRNIVITGQTGTGKSSACKTIVKGLASLGYSLLILDFHNEYIGLAGEIGVKVYDADMLQMDIMQQDGSNEEKAADVAETLRKILKLGYRQYNELYKLALYTYSVCERTGKEPSIAQLLYSLAVFSKNAKGTEANILDVLKTRLVLLAHKTNAVHVDFEKTIETGAVFALAGMHNNETQTAFAESFIRRLYQQVLRKRPSKNIYLVVEEAGKLQNSVTLDRLIAEGRKYGVGIIAIAQRAKAISSEIRSNAELFIAFYQREPEELNYLTNMLAAGNELERFIEVKKALRSLQRGTALVLRNGNIEMARFNTTTTRQNWEYTIMHILKKPISREELLDKLSQCRETEELIAQKLASREISEYRINNGIYAGLYYIATSSLRNSAEHDIMLELIAKHIRSKGISCKVLNRAYAPDIVAYENGKEVAIEYETGKKQLDDTKQMLEKRKGNYAKTIVIVNNSALERYKALENGNIKVISEKEFFENQQPL
ncbi:MAG: DUF87 domain-containing protein [Candidatus Micrarchaeaceae archaeon]